MSNTGARPGEEEGMRVQMRPELCCADSMGVNECTVIRALHGGIGAQAGQRM